MKIKNLNGFLFEENKGLLMFLNSEEIKDIKEIEKTDLNEFYEKFKYNCEGYHNNIKEYAK